MSEQYGFYAEMTKDLYEDAAFDQDAYAEHMLGYYLKAHNLRLSGEPVIEYVPKVVKDFEYEPEMVACRFSFEGEPA